MSRPQAVRLAQVWQAYVGNVLDFLVEKYNIAPISTPEEDLKKLLK